MNLSISQSMQMTLLLLVLSVAGLAILWYAVGMVEPLEADVSVIGLSLEGRLVRAKGVIADIRRTKSGTVFWTVGDENGNVTVPLFEKRFKAMVAEEGYAVEVVGLVSEYNDEIELVPKDITILEEFGIGEEESAEYEG